MSSGKVIQHISLLVVCIYSVYTQTIRIVAVKGARTLAASTSSQRDLGKTSGVLLSCLAFLTECRMTSSFGKFSDGYSSSDAEVNPRSKKRKGGETHADTASFGGNSSSEEYLAADGSRDNKTSRSGVGYKRAKKRPRTKQRPEMAQKSSNSDTPGAWERHTRGIASKILAKHGFTGRLGKNADGIVSPIVRPSRPRLLGIGADRVEKRSHSHYKGPASSSSEQMVDEVSDDGDDDTQSDDENDNLANNSRQSRVEKERLTELEQEQKREEALESAKEDALFSAPQLVDNICMLRSSAEAQLESRRRKREAEETILRNTRAELSRVQGDLHEAERISDALSNAHSAIVSIVSLATNPTNDTKSFQAIIENAASIINRSSVSVARHSVVKAILAVATSYVQKQLTTALSDAMKRGKGNRSASTIVAETLKTVRKAVPHENYVKVCATAVLPPLVAVVSDPEWDAVRGVGIADILNCLHGVLPPAILNVFSEDTLAPRLSLAARGARTSVPDSVPNKVVPMRVWIHPWLPICGRAALVDTLHQVRLQLITALTRWKATDGEEATLRLVAEVGAWNGVVSRRKVQIALASNVVPKICEAVRNLSSAELADWSTTGVIVKAWASVIARRVLCDPLGDALLHGPGIVLRNASFGPGGWTKGRDAYRIVIEWLPSRLKDGLKRQLAALLFVVHAARVTEQDPDLMSRLMQTPLTPLLVNPFIPDPDPKSSRRGRNAHQKSYV